MDPKDPNNPRKQIGANKNLA
ncbi:hypothetical protein CCACVL1_30379 [Corchorus capsularis]|uniref:Uncharacterized protein n=1 Tax=Corchorus capsularis TaxID=210143 RepID=A0A1R3FXH4_COCAP|nr:hypothetical protein CCACVL1_30379 [Corchorus capsularis]